MELRVLCVRAIDISHDLSVSVVASTIRGLDKGWSCCIVGKVCITLSAPRLYDQGRLVLKISLLKSHKQINNRKRNSLKEIYRYEPLSDTRIWTVWAKALSAILSTSL